MPFALITGGGSLICEGVAQCLARDGWDLAVTDLNGDNAATVAARIEGHGRIEAHALDARRIEDVEALVSDLAARYGSIDGLVNGAGGARGIGFQRKPFAQTSQD
ncbi:MAG: SDR family oxidoreductase, partial [Beijerinckiaceae bacterium]|nr:SDR family oxidoreductase [Beijerinckiaceae bacterium]